MIKRLAFALAFLGAGAAAVAQPAAPNSAPPKLIVVISVDQLSSDLWDEYRDQFEGGLARLGEGAVYRNGYQSHAATETCPGHSTILTGTRPARTGIIANVWTDQKVGRADKRVYCAENEAIAGTSSTEYRASAVHLKVPTLGELMKRRWPQSRNVAIAGKDRAALMMSGQTADQRWYWNGKAFVTDIQGLPAPGVVTAANVAVAQKIVAPQPGLTPPAYCRAKSATFDLPGGMKVGNGVLSRSAGHPNGFPRSPEYDGAVLALSAAMIEQMQLGRGAAPDIISIGLSATDYVGHAYGPGGQEMCIQLMSLDRDLGSFLAFLDSTKVDYALVLTADHGGLDIPERLRARGVKDAAWADPALAASALGASVGRSLGLSGPILFGDVAGDIWFDVGLGTSDRARAEAALLKAYRSNPQVDAAFTKAEIAATPMPAGSPTGWSVLQRVRASFDPARSGDLYLVLKPNVMPITKPADGYISTHGSPWDYDRRVPIMFWRRPQFPMASENVVETVDIMPTLAALLGLSLEPASVDGQCLQSYRNVVCSTR